MGDVTVITGGATGFMVLTGSMAATVTGVMVIIAGANP
jgi:hypothetical protein